MRKFNLIAVVTGALLPAIFSADAPAQTDHRALTSNSHGFIFEERRRIAAALQPTELIQRLCGGTTRALDRCPANVHTSKADIDDLTANLPHLRLDIVWQQMQNVVVAGDGVDSLGVAQEPWATFKIESTSADVSIPVLGSGPYGLPVPAPGDTWQSGPFANGLFQGIIHNGCLGPGTFDLTLDSSIYRPSSGETFGQVHLVDAVDGPGDYTFRYVIRATDEAGNVSDFIFSGDADAYCTAQPSLASAIKPPGAFQVGSEATPSASTLANFPLAPATVKRSDFFTQDDIDRSADGYKLWIPDVGQVSVLEVRSRVGGYRCSVHKDSLMKAIAKDPPVSYQPEWLEMAIFQCPWGLCCFSLDGSCFIIIKKNP